MQNHQTFTQSLTSKGQVTIPLSVRKILGVKPREAIVFHVSGKTIEVKPAPFTLAETFGAVKPLAKPLSIKHMREIIKDERAEAFKKKFIK